MSEDEFQLPTLGDCAFDASGLFHETATMCRAHSSWWGHAISYKKSADLLVNQALLRRSELDIVILPVCFLYRHYLELALKALARDVATIKGVDAPKLDHGLMERWSFAREYMGDNPDEDDALAATESLLKEWSEIDPNSFSFRYPTTKEGKPSLPESFTQLNIRQLRDAIEKVDRVFSGISELLAEDIEVMNDMLYDMV